jgi:anti-sigma regulatory factor (Ser/Thr protein kinase)
MRMCWQATQTYPCDRTSPRRARAFLLDQLTAALGSAEALGDITAAAETVTSELMTNALNARSRRARLTLAIHRTLACITVVDDAPGVPRPKTVGPQEASGRGLQIVSRLSDRWGVDRLADGKRVWAEFDLPWHATQALTCHVS